MSLGETVTYVLVHSSIVPSRFPNEKSYGGRRHVPCVNDAQTLAMARGAPSPIGWEKAGMRVLFRWNFPEIATLHYRACGDTFFL
jgi:hypothetical protein